MEAGVFSLSKKYRREGKVWRGNRQGSPLRVERSGSPARRRPKVEEIVPISSTFAQLGEKVRLTPAIYAKLPPVSLWKPGFFA